MRHQNSNNFLGIDDAIVAGFSFFTKQVVSDNAKDIQKSVSAIASQAAEKINTHNAVSEALLNELMTVKLEPYKKNIASYVIVGVIVVILIILVIILIKNRK